MRRQSKKSLYESIMRDVAKVVKRRLNESDEEINRPRSYSLSEIPYEWLLNQELNKKFNRLKPELFKLDNKGRIGINLYSLGINDDDYDDAPPTNLKPMMTIYAENIAQLCCKVYYLYNVTQNKINPCNKYFFKVFKTFERNSIKFNHLLGNFSDLIDELKKVDPWFINHPKRYAGGFLKLFGSNEEKAKLILDVFNHVEKVYPFSRLINATYGEIEKELHDIFS